MNIASNLSMLPKSTSFPRDRYSYFPSEADLTIFIRTHLNIGIRFVLYVGYIDRLGSSTLIIQPHFLGLYCVECSNYMITQFNEVNLQNMGESNGSKPSQNTWKSGLQNLWNVMSVVWIKFCSVLL